MTKQFFNLHINLIRALTAMFLAAVILLGTSPAMARLDELIVGNKYISPPVALVEDDNQSLYEVKPGDTLTDIARLNGISLETLALANRLPDRDHIKAGQRLKIPSDCIVHLVQPGETLLDISKLYHVNVNVIAARNGQADPNTILAGQKLMIPRSFPALEPLPSRGLAAGWLSWPLYGAISSPFGLRDGKPHEGIDIAVEEGTPIRAAAPGRVVFTGSRGTYGLAVIIDHGDGLRTLYAHCSKILVAEGDPVDTTTVLALAGNTGKSTGPHLHLEVLMNGTPLDPLNYLEQEHYYG
ncbi:Murein DD-endopeptidase MepM [Pelotomaculum schinkii]|uniref:Murein DD-endopeptidase MepM n=1 Tax=Pelotomaculum schinkii TaxID=78350 RepID=A0A4Y7R6E6_9FIRM|nr:M23 family metallopeptidase [Pelotomaculum schinkii]TEB04211.1 Murein DD-endopeptidase MepM [Pelotomaculum schinkii]